MSKKVLVVDDEPDLLNVIRQLLLREKLTVQAASNGVEAQKALAAGRFDLVISDFKMPDMNGLDLFKSVQITHPTPFILMTGFSDVSSTAQAKELGISGFLAKPFASHDLLESVREVLSAKPQPAVDPKGEFTKLPIDNFICGYEIPYRIYLQLGDDHFVKIAHNGESLDEQRILKYKTDGVRHLYLRNDDFKKFIGFHLSFGKSLAENQGVSSAKKQTYIDNLGRILYERAFIKGLDQDLFEYSKNIVELSLQTLLEDSRAMQLLQQLQEESPSIYVHSLCVSLYSVMVANKLGFFSAPDQFRLALAGFFHDIGKRELGAEVLNNKDSELNAEQREILASHPAIGAEMLKNLTSIPKEVPLIILHHEDCYGTSLWSANKEAQWLPLAHITAVVNRFCNLLVFKNRDLSDVQLAFTTLMKAEPHIEKKMVDALSNAFNLPQP